MENYYEFINNCRLETPELGHYHHIIPKCLGGSDDESNLIYLSYENHQKAHMFLSEEFPPNSKERNQQLLSAQLLNSWTKNPDVILNGWSHSEETKIKMRGKRGLNPNYVNPFKGKKHSKEWKENLSKKNSTINFNSIKQLTKEGVLIREYTSISDIIEKNPQYNKSNICNVLKGRGKSSYGYRWEYNI